MNGQRITLRVARAERETKRIATLYFDTRIECRPGQFLMVSDLAGGEKPISVSSADSRGFTISVKTAGPVTERLTALRPGEMLSIRGPYGSPFFLHKGHALLIGGGCGTAPLNFLASRLRAAGTPVTVISGARIASELFFGPRFADLGCEYLEATDDGSRGFHGPVSGLALELLTKRSFDAVYVSGPERMLAGLLRSLPAGIPAQYLVERYMKCAIGICGQCTLDPLGIRVCVEGPVLPAELLRQSSEFGTYRRDPCGSRIAIKA